MSFVFSQGSMPPPPTSTITSSSDGRIPRRLLMQAHKRPGTEFVPRERPRESFDDVLAKYPIGKRSGVLLIPVASSDDPLEFFRSNTERFMKENYGDDDESSLNETMTVCDSNSSVGSFAFDEELTLEDLDFVSTEDSLDSLASHRETFDIEVGGFPENSPLFQENLSRAEDSLSHMVINTPHTPKTIQKPKKMKSLSHNLFKPIIKKQKHVKRDDDYEDLFLKKSARVKSLKGVGYDGILWEEGETSCSEVSKRDFSKNDELDLSIEDSTGIKGDQKLIQRSGVRHCISYTVTWNTLSYYFTKEFLPKIYSAQLTNTESMSSNIHVLLAGAGVLEPNEGVDSCEFKLLYCISGVVTCECDHSDLSLTKGSALHFLPKEYIKITDKCGASCVLVVNIKVNRSTQPHEIGVDLVSQSGLVENIQTGCCRSIIHIGVRKLFITHSEIEIKAHSSIELSISVIHVLYCVEGYVDITLKSSTLEFTRGEIVQVQSASELQPSKCVLKNSRNERCIVFVIIIQ